MAKISLPVVPYFRSVIEEGQKVVWPARDTVIRHTIMVIVSVAVAISIFASIDYGLQKLVILAITK